MKLRCKIADQEAIRQFTNIVNNVSRISKLCVLRFTENELFFIVGDERVSTVWIEISENNYFVEYTVIGGSSTHEIYIELDVLTLARSLLLPRTIPKSVIIKITNNRQPCLTLENELPSLNANCRYCIHDIPIRIIPRDEWREYQAPNVPKFDISLNMPPLKYVRNVVDRMKNMSSKLTVSADKTGMFVLSIDTDSATVSTHFQDLKIWDCTQQDGNENVSATVEVKKFLMFPGWEIGNPNCVKCNILQDRMVNLFLDVTDDLKIQYFIPALAI